MILLGVPDPPVSPSYMPAKKRAYRNSGITIGGCQIPVKRAIRYFGVYLDIRLSFVENTTKTTAGAKKVTVTLGRLMTNVGGF